MEEKLWSRLNQDNFIKVYDLNDRTIYEFDKLTIYIREHVTKIGFDEDGTGCAMLPVSEELAKQIKEKLKEYK